MITTGGDPPGRERASLTRPHPGSETGTIINPGFGSVNGWDFDVWLARRFVHLAGKNLQLGGDVDVLGTRLLRSIGAVYRRFIFSGVSEDRIRTRASMAQLSAWLVQKKEAYGNN